MANKIYTIGREFGSGGREVGEKLAAKLGIKLYDKELLQQAAKDSGFCEEIFENHDEKPTNSFLYSLVMDTYSVSGYSAAPFLDMPLNHKVFLAQFETIKKIAEKESCVIVGRCADYILRDKNPLRIFVYADMDFKLARCRQKGEPTETKNDAELKRKMNAIDRQRAQYYQCHTGRTWGEKSGYDLCINMTSLEIKNVAAAIAGLS